MRALLLRFITALLVAAAAPAAAGAQTTTHADLEQIFTQMATAWNAGDMSGHVAPYADSATMMTGRGPAGGRERIAEMLSRAFWRDGRPMQQLRFEQVLVRPIGTDGAVVTGRFILSGGERDEQTGWFTTVWERTADGWRIVHDHSG